MSRIDPKLTTSTDVPRIAPDLLEAARLLPAATLHEAAGKIGVLPPAIRPIAPGFTVCGPALTVHSPGGDNLWLHRALELVQPGDIMVVYTSGVYDHGYWGEIMATAAQTAGLAGLVIDGCVRDAARMEEMGFPVFARGMCIRGTGKDFGATGWINSRILLGEVSIGPGDLIVGDRDGVVAIPHARIAEVISASQQREAQEAGLLERLRAGESTMRVYGWDQ